MNKPSSRLLCSRCHRPAITCFCALLVSVNNLVEVVILRHPAEAGNAKNTAGFLHLCLTRSHLLDGETFAGADLKSLLDDPMYQQVLLYPETPEARALSMPASRPFERDSGRPAYRIRLWVLDATWRKSRKMLYLNPWLQHLPRLSLVDAPASRYVIRKSQAVNQLSTLEATCHALQQLEQHQVDYQPLLAAFDNLMQQHQTFLPPERMQPSADS